MSFNRQADVDTFPLSLPRRVLPMVSMAPCGLSARALTATPVHLQHPSREGMGKDKKRGMIYEG